jgi:hypothetical protein
LHSPASGRSQRMASFFKGSGRAAPQSDARVEAIDLTLSSPEPERRSRVLLHQQRLPTYFQGDPSHDRKVAQVKSEGKRVKMPPSRSDSRARSIDPQHLAQIIGTSSSQAVRDVLTDLCKLSPALRGAVARGLARHSTYAQGLIRHHQPTSRVPVIKTHTVRREREDSGDARMRMKQRLEARRTASGSSLNRSHELSASSSTHGTRPTGFQSVRKSSNSTAHAMWPAVSQSVPRVKLERQLDLSDSDSDEDQYIPSHFPLNTQPAASSRLPLRDETRSNTAGRTPNSVPLSERPIRAPVVVQPPIGAKTCTQCREVVEGEEEGGLCFFHTGPELQVNGKPTCGGCKQSWKASTNCAFGTHVPKDVTLNLPTRSQGQGDRSRSPSKRPRIS